MLVTTPSGAATTATTNRDGLFEVKGLVPGKYGVKVIAPGFAPFEKAEIEIAAGQIRKVECPTDHRGAAGKGPSHGLDDAGGRESRE